MRMIVNTITYNPKPKYVMSSIRVWTAMSANQVPETLNHAGCDK
jgi:hypothetical protein